MPDGHPGIADDFEPRLTDTEREGKVVSKFLALLILLVRVKPSDVIEAMISEFVENVIRDEQTEAPARIHLKGFFSPSRDRCEVL